MRKFRVYAPKLINSSNKTIEEAEPIYGDTTEFIKYIEIEAEEVGDEYHTMHELYQHRMALTIALFNWWAARRKDIELFYNPNEIPNAPPEVIKSKLHHDGTMFDDYFIVMTIIPDIGQISYHYNLKHWDKFRIPEVDKALKWDGHNSNDVLERLMKL